MAGKKRRGKQLELGFPEWGGKRKGAGRPPKGRVAGVSHLKRTKMASRYPLHVTVKMRGDVPSGRTLKARGVIREAFRAGKERFGFRLIHYSVQSDHMHLIVEGKDRRAISRGMQGLLIRVAKRLNKAFGRKGKVFADRYHDHVLRTPREVRNAIRYVFANARKHHQELTARFDPHSSAEWFDGWRGLRRPTDLHASPVVRAHTWLLDVGWRRHGLLPLPSDP